MTAIMVLKLDDAAQMAALHHGAFPTGGAWAREGFVDLLKLQTTLALGIQGEVGLCGLILLQVTPDHAEILTIAVTPHQRRKGFAGTLLAGAAQILGQKGVAKMLLDVAADNSGAINFYKAQGFTQDGLRKAYYKRLDGSRIDAMLMSRSVAGQHP